MKYLRNSVTLQKALAFIFLLIFCFFAIFYTISNLKETEKNYNKKRIVFTKKLAEEICGLIEQNIDIGSKLSNILVEDSVAYSLVHSRDGLVVARSESQALPVEIFETAEANAVKTEYLKITSFKDPSERFSFSETAIPFFTKTHSKYILRIGFFRNEEEEQILNIKIRNILVFSLIFIFLISTRFIKYYSSANIKYSLLSFISLAMIILFFASSFIIHKWYDSFFINNFIQNECINQTKMIVPAVEKFIQSSNLVELENSLIPLKNNKNLEILSIIKDDTFIYHTDSSKISSQVSDVFYHKSLNTNNPSVFKHNNSENYTVIIPVLNGINRIGNICTTWIDFNEKKSIYSLRRKLTMVFVFTYLFLYMVIYFLTDKISSNQLLNIEKRIIKDKDNILSNNILSNNDYKNNCQLAVSVFIYFSGINEAIKRIETNILSHSIENSYNLTKKILNSFNYYSIDYRQNGILVIFKNKLEQESIYKSIEFAKILKDDLLKLDNLPFSPKITINYCKMIPLEENREGTLIGDCLFDYKTVAKIQSNNEIIVSEDFYNMIKDLVNVETLEIISPECGNFNVYSIEDYKVDKELLEIFNYSSSEWTKIMIMRIIKNDNEFDINKINDLINNNSEV